MSAAGPLLEAVGLTKGYTVPTRFFAGASRVLPALRGVSFALGRSETLGLVGESGSGKTTAGRIVARLLTPDAGSLRLEGEDWLALSGAALRRRRRDVQIVFQDPLASLNPRMSAGAQVAEPLRIHALAAKGAIAESVRSLLGDVGLARETAARFPHELSGGQRQRVAIARALATRPRLVVCDEPVSALDVSIAAQIVNLLLDLQERRGVSYLFISHDLAVVSRVAHRVAVLYLGAVVEQGPAAVVVREPLHPYTAALVASASASPRPGWRPKPGPPPSALDPPPGCPFHPRCPIARERCAREAPALADAGPGRRVACFYPGEMG
ncbi:MAG TPA: oligopeptide/dipeptide ABC transporter ATP-binding protein [Thermoanaerobaculia bacterium]|nr:oligopeptide/dipeptide ABC transporter ATP-binding protein [Thermoanaerobaculia bacterium]